MTFNVQKMPLWYTNLPTVGGDIPSTHAWLLDPLRPHPLGKILGTPLEAMYIFQALSRSKINGDFCTKTEK